MMHLYDRATMARALALDLDPRLHALLAERIAALETQYGELTDHTEFLIVEPGDTEADIIRTLGFTPLIDPIDRHRWPDPRFQPGWDYIADRDGWFELIFTFGSTFAYVLFVGDSAGDAEELVVLCRTFVAAEPNG